MISTQTLFWHYIYTYTHSHWGLIRFKNSNTVLNQGLHVRCEEKFTLDKEQVVGISRSRQLSKIYK